jgi:phage-related protein
MKRDVRFYQTDEGRCPVREFIDSLPGKAAQKVVWTLSLLEELGTLSAAYFKKLVNSDDIWEVRVSLGSDAYRIFCFFAGNSIVVLTHGLVKKTQKTPPREIERAEECKRKYLSRRSSS